jgi:hypothetical protein
LKARVERKPGIGGVEDMEAKKTYKLMRVVSVVIVLGLMIIWHTLTNFHDAKGNDILDPKLVGESLGGGTYKTANRYGQDKVLLRNRAGGDLALPRLLEEKAGLDRLGRGGINATTLTEALLEGDIVALSDPILDITTKSGAYSDPSTLITYFGDDLDMAIDEVQRLRRGLRNRYDVTDLQGGFKDRILYVMDPWCVDDISGATAALRKKVGLQTKKDIYNEFLKPLLIAKHVKEGKPVPLSLSDGAPIIMGSSRSGSSPSGSGGAGIGVPSPKPSFGPGGAGAGAVGRGISPALSPQNVPVQLRQGAGGPGNILGGTPGVAGTTGMMNLGAPVPPYNTSPGSRYGGMGGPCNVMVCAY